jgi:4a-hydroxytetrahydrobiopterin dehydratase
VDILSRSDAQAAVQPYGWSYLLGALVVRFPVATVVEGVELARVAADAAGPESQDRLQIDVRAEGVRLSVADRRVGITASEVALVERIAAALRARGAQPVPALTAEGSHPVVELELAIDTADAERIAPFWLAALGYDRSAYANGAIVDPAGRLPTIWFQDMDPVRTQRNRIHLDVTVAHEESDGRIAAVLAAGGMVGPTSSPPAYTVLIDADGNEVCICTWLGRDDVIS